MRPPQASTPGLTYLRLSVTDQCNLRCRYCRPAQGLTPPGPVPANDEELLALVRLIDGESPLYKVRITGGEPLLRPGLLDLIAQLRAQLPGLELALTTNGVQLAGQAQALRRAGISALNISLDTLIADDYAQLTRGGRLSTMLDGLCAAQAAGFRQLRLNAVLMRTCNGARLADLVRLAGRHQAELRFIELMPYGEGAAMHAEEYLSGAEALECLRGQFADLGPAAPSATARRQRLLVDGREQIIGFITPVSQAFCGTCDRLRLDSRGRLFACLRQSQGVELLALLRAGQFDNARARIRDATHGKSLPPGNWPTQSLIALGG